MIWRCDFPRNAVAAKESELLEILRPLNYLSAPIFMVEMNLPISQNIVNELGQLAFTPVLKVRPFDYTLFGGRV